MGLVLFRIEVGLFSLRMGSGLAMLQFFFFLDYSSIFFFFLGFFSLLESRTNNKAKFNFIGIKKIEGVPKFFLKGRQIKILNYYM